MGDEKRKYAMPYERRHLLKSNAYQVIANETGYKPRTVGAMIRGDRTMAPEVKIIADRLANNREKELHKLMNVEMASL